MIHALLQYAEDRGLISKPGYAKKTVKWILDFNAEGNRFLALISSDKEFLSAPDLSQPDLKTLGAKRRIELGTQRGLGAHFLVAPLGQFIGWGKDEAEESVESVKHATLVWMMKEAFRFDQSLSSLARTLADDQSLNEMRNAVLSAKPAAKPTDSATIRLGGRFPVEENLWHSWWDEFRASLRKPIKGQRFMACFGSGLPILPEKTHPHLQRLPREVGFSMSHAPLITFDKEAFESYGLSQGENAAIGGELASAYVNAINRLLEDSVTIGGAKIAYWYTGPDKRYVEEVEKSNDLISLTFMSINGVKEKTDDLEEKRILFESRLRKAIERIRSGGNAQYIGSVRFCVFALSGAGARAMVRDFMEGTVLQLATTTEKWFDDLSLEKYRGGNSYPPSLEMVLTAPLNPKRPDQDYVKWVTPTGTWRQALWRSALTGGRLPETAFNRALMAHNNMVVRGDLTDEKKGPEAQRHSRLRLALVKAYLIRKGVDMKPALDPEHPSAAYHCGRLLALYDSLQRTALGDVGTGVVQRFYGGALTNPSGVFGQLSRMAQTHLSKLDGGLSHIYTERIAEIHNGITKIDNVSASYPSALDLEGQALFALGFWHQTAFDNKNKTDAIAAKKVREQAKNVGSSNEEDEDE